jgi:hypothetical protein
MSRAPSRRGSTSCVATPRWRARWDVPARAACASTSPGTVSPRSSRRVYVSTLAETAQPVTLGPAYPSLATLDRRETRRAA